MRTITNREELVPILISRIVENAPVRELIRVYGEAVTAAVNGLDDEQLAQAIENSGYLDLTEQFVSDGAVEEEPAPEKPKRVKKQKASE